MKILFDQGVPVPLRRWLLGHTESTAYESGWSQLTNGKLLEAAVQAGYELLVTTDQNLQHQQNLASRLSLRKQIDNLYSALFENQSF